MNAEADRHAPATEVLPRRRAFDALGVAAALCGGALAARLIWEQTWLTWQSGPQMVGFSLAHGYAAPLLLVAPLSLFIWIVAILIHVGRARQRRAKLSRLDWAHGATATLIVIALFTPYSWWQAAFARRLAQGPHATEFLTYAAASGDLRTVKALASHGAPLSGMDPEGQTTLGAAAAGNHTDVIAFLLAHGLPINVVNASGDSPLDDAIENRATDAVALLTSHGGVRIHGSDAQHDSVIRAMVDRSIKELDGSGHR
jgi:hypothetical protein